MVTEGGLVENRIVELPPGLPPSVLTEASNYLNARLKGQMLDELRRQVETDIAQRRAELDELTSRVVQAGLATRGEGPQGPALIVRGRAQLLTDVSALADLERIGSLVATPGAKASKVRRSEEHPAGNEGVSTAISRWAPDDNKK